ncbi:MAG: histidinol-phosphate transaminase [Deinococcales bacterium]
MSIRPEIKALGAYKFEAKAYQVKLDQNESPYDLPQALKEKLLERLLNIPFNRYPDLKAESLSDLLAQKLGWPAKGILVGPGSNTLLRRFVEGCGIGQRVLTLHPTFSVYSLDANTLDPISLSEVPLNDDFSLPLKTLKAELAQGTGVFFIANPAAPSGNLHPEAEVISLIEAAKEHSWTVVIDEAYHQFSGTDYKNIVKRYPNVISVRTFSKAYGLAGIRLGYCFGHPEIIGELRKTLTPFGISSLQLETLKLVLSEGDEFVERYIAEVKSERERIFKALDALAIPYKPSVTNFFLILSDEPAKLYQALLDKGILVRRQDHLIQGALRVSIGTPSENDAFLSALAAIKAF